MIELQPISFHASEMTRMPRNLLLSIRKLTGSKPMLVMIELITPVEPRNETKMP